MKKIKQKKEIIVQGIIFSFIPSLFAYLGQSNSILDYLKNNNFIGASVNIEQVKDLCILGNIILTFLLLTSNIIMSQLRENEYKKQMNAFIKFNREIFIKTLVNAMGKEYANINIRIFVPSQPLLWNIKKVLWKNTKLYFVIKNVEGLAEPGLTNNLSFEVEPSQQGLVGECYHSHQMIFDDDLENNNETNYNLNGYQINKTNNLKFILVCPLFDEVKNDKITAIVAFDSTYPIKIDKSKESILRRSILNYTQQLQEYAPELFKKAGGIL